MKTFSDKGVCVISVNLKTGEVRVSGDDPCEICKLFGNKCKGNLRGPGAKCLVLCG